MIGTMTGHWEATRKKLVAFLRRWWKQLTAIGGAITALVTILGWLLNQYQLTTPSIQFAYAETEAPFSVPFVLTNQSSYLAMSDVSWFCYIVDLQDTGGNSTPDNLLGSGHIPIVFPSQVLNYYCPANWILNQHYVIVHTTVCIVVTYKTFDFDRAAHSQLFHWNNQSRRWLNGGVVGLTSSRRCGGSFPVRGAPATPAS
jgi:hypothetical protein